MRAYHFDWSILWGEWGLLLLQGLYVTVQLAAVTLVFALLIGLIFGIARWLGKWYLEPICWLYIE
jgi:ABC-type amino acid transport system permease subunit